jgi:hypothetical protein
MDPREDLVSQIGDKRRHRRRTSGGQVRLTIEPVQVVGEAENVSRSGILFFSEGNLRVRVEVEENGGITKKSGRLVRAQRMRGDSFGWAVEFDP